MKINLIPLFVLPSAGPAALAVALCVCATGCAGRIALTKEARSTIRTVHVKEATNPPPKNLSYSGPTQALLGGTFGIFGAVIGSQAAKGPAAQLNAAISAAKIDLGQIVYDEFSNQLKNSNVLTVVQENADAQFDLVVDSHGFAIPIGSAKDLKPLLGVTGQLVRRDGTVIWKKRAFVTNLNGRTPSHPLKEYLSEPELIRSAFKSASELVTADLMRDLDPKR